MNARIAGHAGTPQLKQFLMVSIKEFPRGINSDQVISLRAHDGECERAPGPGQQLGEVQPWDREATPSYKPQATSSKHQASSEPEPGSGSASLTHQATSIKP